MSLSHAPSIVADGLVFAYDQNSIRSYKGPVVQNLANVVGLTGIRTSTGYSSTGTTETVTIPDVGSVLAYKNTIQNNYTSFTPNSNDCCPSLHYWGNIAVTPSTLYTYLILYKCDSGYTNSNYMYRYEYASNGGAYVTEGGVHSNANRVHLGGGWYYAWGNFTTQATTNWLGHCGTFYYRYSNVPDRLYVAKVAIIPGNYAGLHPKYWPNSASTRSSTQSIVDITNNTTITADNLNYASDGTFTFNGTSSVVATSTLPYPLLQTGFSISVWMNQSTPTANDNVVSWGNSAFNMTAYAWELRIRGGQNTNVEFSPGVGPGGVGTPVRLSYNQGSSPLTGRVAVIDVTFFANGVASIYENGQLKNSIDYAGIGVYSTLNALRIGQGTDSFFPGRIYNVRLYNRALSAAEVKQNFNALRGRYGI